MRLNRLDSKKQFVILISMIIVLFGVYIKYRMMPAIGELGSLNKQLKTDRALLKKPDIPEEPFDDIDALEDNLADLEVELEQLTMQSSSLAKKLPEVNSQDVMLKISEAARESRVRIVNNVPFLTRKRIQLNFDENTGKKLSKKEQKKREKRIRKAIKKARKKAARTAGVGVFTREGELMDKLVNDFEVSRPLHELKIEGTYGNVKSFIEALQGLPWQITVVKINYKLLGANAAQGYPQPLIVDMIIGA